MGSLDGPLPGRSPHGAAVEGPLDAVRRIAVLRPGAVGDFVFALPALHALKKTYPEAILVLLGKAWHAGFLHGRPGPIDRVVAMPPVPGVTVPATPVGTASGVAGATSCTSTVATTSPTSPTSFTSSTSSASSESLTPSAIDRFVDTMRAQRFDLALQLHGGGRYSNPFLRRLDARLTVGACTPDAVALDRWIAYREPAPRRLALLEIAALAGARLRLPLAQPELAVTAADRREAAAVLPLVPGERLVVLQPGSTDPRRRWPAPCFAELGDRLARAGARIAINGGPDERALVDEVAGGMRQPAVRLAGRLGLGGLCGVLERAAVLVSNDTGPLHLALALGVRSVGIFWLTNLIEGLPLQPSLLHAALSLRTRCPVCGQENLDTRCAHDASFVADVGVDEVHARVLAALAQPV
jgi:ADP-heptose:LPS heptosyltransferase